MTSRTESRANVVSIDLNAPLSLAVAQVEEWWAQHSARRREELEHGMRRDGADRDTIEEALIWFDEHDRECRSRALQKLVDEFTTQKREGSGAPN